MSKIKLFLMISLLFFSSCSKKNKQNQNVGDIKGDLSVVIKDRNLSEDDLMAAVKTYSPSGGRDEYLAFFGTGVSGRLAVMAIPSMKILKYVAVFSAEAWQGFSFDDESKRIIQKSSRDEVNYTFGDMGSPALSLTNGEQNGKALFVGDGSNARLGLVDLKEYETKQVVTNPIFKNSNPDVAISSNTKYVVQTTKYPVALDDTNPSIVSGATFWRINEIKNEEHGGYFIDEASSFSVLLPADQLSSPAMGRGKNENLMISISQAEEPFLNIIDWSKADSLLATKTKKINNHLVLSQDVATTSGILSRFKLPAGSNNVVISGDGQYLAITNKVNPTIGLIKIDELLSGSLPKLINVGGVSVDAAFTDKNLYVTVNDPYQIAKISLADGTVSLTHKLDFPVGKILIPEAGTKSAIDRYAIVTNHMPYGRFTRIGPQQGLSVQLIDLRDGAIKSLYDASIPQSTRLSAVAMSTKVNDPVYRYKIGTNPRTGLISEYKANAGNERVVRDGNRVHVYATVIRSHINPDSIEVDQGDLVTIHLTSNEQSKDTTHGFTIDTYNVHGSFEPGKTASLTFLADRAGVFPFYCTEFCSALHLEMQGYLLVRPVALEKRNSAKLTKMRNNLKMTSFFNYIKGENYESGF